MTAREQRTLRWGAAAGGLILGYVLLFDPHLARSAERRSLIEERESRLLRMTALERSLPVQRERLRRAQTTWDAEIGPRLLPGDIPAVAASALSEEVRAIAAQSFLEIERENVLPPEDVGGLTGVPVQFSLRGDVYGLRDFLAAVEATDTFLHLRELRVNAAAVNFGGAPESVAPLQFTVTLEGYLGGTESAAVTSSGPGEGPSVRPRQFPSVAPREVPDALPGEEGP